MAKMTPLIRGDRLVYQQDEQEQVLLIETPAWFAWLETASSFTFMSEAGTFTARKERAGNQRGGWYWKAYRTQRGKRTSLYIGKSETLTHDRLHAVVTTLNTQTASTEQRLDAPHAASMIPGAFSPAPSETTLRPREEMLLATKWFIPPSAPTLVARPRLIARLTEGVLCPLTLLCAPAGWGKTTVLSTWYADSSRRAAVAWVSLDTHDNDPIRFWTYIITALTTLHAGVGDTALALLHSPQMPPMERVLTSLVNALTILLTETVLVLDDYHFIEAQPIHQALSFLFDHMPPQLHLVIATRSDPPLPLSRLLVRGQLTEIRATELRFTSGEAAAFLTQVMGFSLTAEQIEALETRTEGWIAGLHLAALTMRDRTDVASFIATFTGSNRYVVDYLVEEVLQRQPEHLQHFLLHTCLLDQLSGPLCDATLDMNGSQSLLEQLEHANVFLIPLDDERGWYRYHHLFADALRSRLQQTQPMLIPGLHHRASIWYEEHDMLIEAVQHALATPHFERAARLIEQSGLLLMQHGRVHTFLGWISALPDPLVRTRPTLCLFHANALMFTHRLEEALARLRDAETCVEADMPAEQSRSIMGEVAWLRGTIVRFSGDLAGCVALSRQALDLLPESEVSWRAFALLNESYAFLVSGDVTTATEHQLSEVAAPVYASGNPYGILGVIVLLARMRVLQGRLRQAAATYDEMKQLVQGQEGFRLLTNSSYYFGMGDLLREWNELDAAERSIVQGMEVLSMMTINADMIALGYICLAGLHQARGEAEQALATLDTFTQLARQNHFTPLLVAHMSAVRAQLQLAQGDLAAALRWVDTSGLLLHNEQPGYSRNEPI